MLPARIRVNPARFAGLHVDVLGTSAGPREPDVALLETDEQSVLIVVYGNRFVPFQGETEHAHVIVFPTPPIYDIAEFRKSVKEPVARRAIRGPGRQPVRVEIGDRRPTGRGAAIFALVFLALYGGLLVWPARDARH